MQGQADLQLVARLFVGEAVGAQSREGIREILALQLFLSVMIGPVLVLAFRRDGMVVDLPAPLGPRNPYTCPPSIVNERSSTATKSP